jgi:hypothetical protein
MSEEIDCIDDALLSDVVAQGQEARRNIRGTYDNPEEAWLDGYVAGRFDGYFKASPMNTQEEHGNAQQSSQAILQ